MEAVAKMREGLIGDLYMARGLCFKRRDTIGRARPEPVPAGVHYDLWLGPAPKTEFTVLAFCVWMGLTYMAVLPPTAGLIGQLYGAKRLPTLLGITFMLHQVGAFLGSWLGGVFVEATGSYDGMWVLDLGLGVAAAALALTIRERAAGRVLTRAALARTLA